MAEEVLGRLTSADRPRRLALGLIFLVVTINLADRQIVNILAQDIKLDLDLSDAQLGLLTGAAFAVIYSLFSLPLAWLADRVNRPRLIAAMLAGWSLCTIICGAATSFIGLFLARMGVGAGEGGAQSACTAYVRDLFPDRPTFALTVMMAGNPVGGFIGLFFGGAIAAAWGWRTAFILAGIPGLVLAVLVLARAREVRSPAPMGASTTILRDIGRLLCRPRITLLIVATTAILLILNVASAWMPAFFIRIHDLNTAEAGLYAALATGVGGGLGISGGWLCDRLAPRVAHIEGKYLVAVILGMIPLLLIAIMATSAPLGLAGYFFYNVLAYSTLGPLTRLIQDAAEPDERALAFAVCGGIAMLFGLGVGVPLVGWISDRLAPGFGARALGEAMLIVLPIAVLVALACQLRLLVMMRLDGAKC